MRPSERVLALALLSGLLAGTVPAPLHAAPAIDPRAKWEHTGPSHWRVKDLLPFVQQLTPTQTILPAGTQGTVVDPSHLEEPVRLERSLRNAIRDPHDEVRLSVTNGTAHMGRTTVESKDVVHGHLVVLKGNAEIHGRVEGNVVALDGDVVLYTGASIVGDVLAIGGQVRQQEGGTITGSASWLEANPDLVAPAAAIPAVIARRGAGLLGFLLTLTVIGFAMVTFARPNLEIVSDTVAHSLARSFLAGLLGELLVLPSIGLLVVGLVLTIIGTVLVPFAIAVFALLVIVALVSGLIAVIYNMGETITRRRMAAGLRASPNAYRFVLTGLAGLAVLWLSWVVFGWVPVAGPLLLAIAVLCTWLIGTIGFGAALLSRGGIREHFAGRLIPAVMLTDEHLWATPRMGVPIVRRPPRGDEQ